MENQPNKEHNNGNSPNHNNYSYSNINDAKEKKLQRIFNWLNRNSSFVVAIANIGLTIVTLILAGVTFLSVNQAKSLVKEGERQSAITDSLVEQTRKAVAVAESTSIISKKSMIIANTPYISICFSPVTKNIENIRQYIPQPIFTNLVKAGKYPAQEIITDFVNVGKTPAIHFKCATSVFIYSDTSNRYSSHIFKEDSGGSVLVPGERFSNRGKPNDFDTLNKYVLTDSTVNLIVCRQLDNGRFLV